jgi:preprotein translocase subunit SecG
MAHKSNLLPFLYTYGFLANDLRTTSSCDSLLRMSTISSVIPYIQIVISVLLILAILLQHSGAQNGGALGGGDMGGSVFHTRRGLEKLLFIATIVLGVLFALTSFVSLIS